MERLAMEHLGFLRELARDAKTGPLAQAGLCFVFEVKAV
jgi:hypothetical protein